MPDSRELWKGTKQNIRDDLEPSSLEDMPITIARSIADEKQLNFKARKQAFVLVRKWVDFSKKYNVNPEDQRSLRYHFGKFCQQEFNTREQILVTPKVESIESLTLPDGENYSDFINRIAGRNIVDEPSVAVYGGVARVGLKLLAMQHGAPIDILDNELPVSDIDIILERQATSTSSTFNADLAGTRVVEDLTQEIPYILTNVDCNFNQSIIRNGELYYTEEAYADVVSGAIHFSDKEDALFGSETDETENGEQYINRGGLYRAFNFLIQGKAKSLSINKENLELEVPKMQNYWGVLLFVKILPIKDEQKRSACLFRWFALAKNLKATQASSPEDFLQELFETSEAVKGFVRNDRGSAKESTSLDQIKRLVSKIVDRGVDHMLPKQAKPAFTSNETVTVDKTYLEGKNFDEKKFLEYLQQLKMSGHN